MTDSVVPAQDSPFHWVGAAQAGFQVLGSVHVRVPGGQEAQGSGAVGPDSRPTPAPAPDLSAWEASLVRTQCPFSRSDGRSRRSRSPFCSGGSGVGERPQRVGFRPRQEEIFPREERGGGVCRDTVSKEAAGVSACPASDQPYQQNMP